MFLIFFSCSIKMTGKIIRPAPAEIEFRNMRFLITDQPQVSPVTSTLPLIGQQQGLSLVRMSRSLLCTELCGGRKYLAHFVNLYYRKCRKSSSIRIKLFFQPLISMLQNPSSDPIYAFLFCTASIFFWLRI